MTHLATTLQTRFEAAFKASAFKSRRKLSDASECSPSQAGKVMAGQFTKDGPGVLGLWRMAEEMEISLNDLLPPSRKKPDRPGIQSFFDRYYKQKPKMSDFTGLLDFCDVYDEPGPEGSRLVSVGAKSLLGEKSQILDAKTHQKDYDAWPSERRQRIAEWQRRAWDQGATSEVEYYQGSILVNNRHSEGLILKSACRVLCDDFKERLLVYCEQVG